MSEQPRNIRALFLEAEQARKKLQASYDTNSSTYQDTLRKTITTYEECLKLSDEVSLFSPNESLDDISSSDLQ
jgi:immunoglobulin-binding protein 1